MRGEEKKRGRRVLRSLSLNGKKKKKKKCVSCLYILIQPKIMKKKIAIKSIQNIQIQFVLERRFFTTCDVVVIVVDDMVREGGGVVVETGLSFST